MAIIDPSIPRDRVRLMVGDTTDIPILANSVYDYLLQKNNNNENRAARDAAFMILGQLSQNTRERLDRLELFGDQAFNQYLQFINAFIKDPRTSQSIAGGYAGGISIADMDDNLANPDNNIVADPPRARVNYPLSF